MSSGQPSPPLTARVQIQDTIEEVPITEGTRVSQLRVQIADGLGEIPSNVRLTCHNSELPANLRVCALPPGRVMKCEFLVPRVLPEERLNTPRLVPTSRREPVLRLLIAADEGPSRFGLPTKLRFSDSCAGLSLLLTVCRRTYFATVVSSSTKASRSRT